jgi:transcriptional antiterminator NusG
MVIPTETVTEIKGGKKRERSRKSHPGYLYLEIDTIQDNSEQAEQRYRLNNQAYDVIRGTPGVGDFVGDRDKPVPMAEEDVRKVLRISEPVPEGETPTVKIEFKKGDAVKIKEGSFDGFEGVVDDVNTDEGKIKVIVTIFSRPTPVWIEYWQVEAVS